MNIELNFSDVGDLAAIGTQYASQGLTFSENAIALRSRDSGGRGNFAPTAAPTLMTYRGDQPIEVGIAETLPAVVSAQLTLRYTSPHLDHTIHVLDGTGAVIDSFVLPKTRPNLEVGGEFDSFQLATFEFSGEGRSLQIGSFANQLGIDEFALNFTLEEEIEDETEDDDLEDEIEDDDLEDETEDETEDEIEDDDLEDDDLEDDDLEDDDLEDDDLEDDDLEDDDLEEEIEEEEPENPIPEDDIVSSDTIVGTPNDDTLVYGEVGRILVNPETLLENDLDPQEEVLTLFGVAERVNGAVSLDNGEIIFVPNDEFFSQDSGQFEYTVINESEGTGNATVTVINTPPQVIDGREGNNTLILNEPVAVDLSQATDQTLGDTITVLGFNNVFGSPGNDTLIGNDQPNLLVGNDGNNTLVGGGGTNTLQGGNGNDLIIASPQDTVSGGNGIDTLIIDSDENLSVQIPNDVEVLITGNGDNVMDGSLETDTLISTGGNNTLFGNGGGDFFSGGPGGDVIVGSSGADSLVFNDPGEGGDTLTSLFESEDAILVSAAGFGGGLTPGVLTPEKFTFGSSASTPDHRFVFEPIATLNGVLHYDPDGNGPEPQVSILNLNEVIISDVDASSIIVF